MAVLLKHFAGYRVGKLQSSRHSSLISTISLGLQCSTLSLSKVYFGQSTTNRTSLTMFGASGLTNIFNVGIGLLRTHHISYCFRLNEKQHSQDLSDKQSVKRFQRRKKVFNGEESFISKTPGLWHVSAYATSEEYNIERLQEGLMQQHLYKPIISIDDPLNKAGADVLRAVANYQVSSELRQIYFFREGSVVFWNIPELECVSVLDFLKHFQIGPYLRPIVLAEKEVMTYKYDMTVKKSILDANTYCISAGSDRTDLDIDFDKFTLSNAMSLSVKLAIWEASLNQYIDSIEYVVDDLKRGKVVRISRQEVTCKTGELFALRHSINLSSDLLDVPDVYWENDQLELLYMQLCSYFSIQRRTKVMNEKLNHCMELVELLTSHLSDRHHVRLEWMIIILIMIEVVIEILHALV